MGGFDDSLDDYYDKYDAQEVSKQTNKALDPSLRQLVNMTRPGEQSITNTMRNKALSAEAAGTRATMEGAQRTIASEFGNSATGLNIAMQHQANLGSARPELEAQIEAARPGVLQNLQTSITQNLQARPQQMNLHTVPYFAQEGVAQGWENLELSEEGMYPPTADGPEWWEGLLGNVLGGAVGSLL